MAHPRTDDSRVDVYLNEDTSPVIMKTYQLHDLHEKWQKQGRTVQVSAHEDDRPGYAYRRPRLDVSVNPPPKRPLWEEITAIA